MTYKNIKGATELERTLAQLPVKLERSILRGAVRAAANVIKPIAVSKAPIRKGKLRGSIRVSTRAKGSTVTAIISAGDRKKGGVFYAHMVEGGTKPHLIKAGKSKSLSIGGGRSVNVRYPSKVNHPGAKPSPFMGPALDQGADEAVKAVGDYIRRRIEKAVK